jgi:protein-S-isoprenylcysteine O-methyltransferase Ste14
VTFALWPTAYLLLLASVFFYFVLAGGRTFELSPDDDTASGVAQLSFYSGIIAAPFLGYGEPLPLWNAVGSGTLFAASVVLYEWARWTIRERRFHIAWSGDVPEALCDQGPYAYIRHPLYASYILAFGALLAAFPKLAALAIFLLNLALFIHAAVTDERAIARSALAEAYARYKRRTGMFLPRLFGRGCSPGV